MSNSECQQKFLPGLQPESLDAQAEIQRVCSSIEACRGRIAERCRELGIPDMDPRSRGPVYRADMAIAAKRRWEAFGGLSPLPYLQGVRRDELLRELALQREQQFNPDEQFTLVMQRTDAQVRQEGESALPLVAHLCQIQDLPLTALTGERSAS